MKWCLSVVLSFLILVFASSAMALELKTHTFEVATETSYINYEEPGLMEETGLMFGIGAIYTFRERVMLRLDTRLAYGRVNYDSRNTGSIDGIDDYIFEIRGLFGKDFVVSPSTTLTPYTGLGYRYLNDDTGGMVSTTGHHGYERESNYIYMPIGIEALVETANGWLIGFVFEYDFFLAGEQVSHLSDVSSNFNDPHNDQDKGYGLRGSVKIVKKIKKFNLLIEPFIRYWNIDDSEIAPLMYNGAVWGYGYEPQNNSTEAGVKVGLIF